MQKLQRKEKHQIKKFLSNFNKTNLNFFFYFFILFSHILIKRPSVSPSFLKSFILPHNLIYFLNNFFMFLFNFFFVTTVKS